MPVRLLTKGGNDNTKRFPWIVEDARKNRESQFIIDGEAVLLGVDGISDIDGLRSGKYDEEVRLYAFDILALDGDDLRTLPLSTPKQKLERLLKLRPNGIFVAPFDQGEIGPDLFRAACSWGLEGLVSKRADRPLRRTVKGLGQDQEPRASSLSAGARSVLEACTAASLQKQPKCELAVWANKGPQPMPVDALCCRRLGVNFSYDWADRD